MSATRASGVSLNELSRVLQITQFQGDIDVYIYIYFFLIRKPNLLLYIWRVSWCGSDVVQLFHLSGSPPMVHSQTASQMIKGARRELPPLTL